MTLLRDSNSDRKKEDENGKLIRIKPILIKGDCPVKIKCDDDFFIAGFELRNPKNSNVCYECTSLFSQSINQLRNNQIIFNIVTCSGCQKNNVKKSYIKFLIAHEDTWEIGKVLYKYSQLLEKHDEPDDAKKLRLKVEKLIYSEKADYEKILKGLKTAFKMFKKCSGSQYSKAIF